MVHAEHVLRYEGLMVMVVTVTIVAIIMPMLHVAVMR